MFRNLQNSRFPDPDGRFLDPDGRFPKRNIIVIKAFAPKFCAECTDRRIHSSHGDYFRDHFCVCVSGQLLGNFWARGSTGSNRFNRFNRFRGSVFSGSNLIRFRFGVFCRFAEFVTLWLCFPCYISFMSLVCSIPLQFPLQVSFDFPSILLS